MSSRRIAAVDAGAVTKVEQVAVCVGGGWTVSSRRIAVVEACAGEVGASVWVGEGCTVSSRRMAAVDAGVVTKEEDVAVPTEGEGCTASSRCIAAVDACADDDDDTFAV